MERAEACEMERGRTSRKAVCCAKRNSKKRQWTPQEDRIVKEFIKEHGARGWKKVAEITGLDRCCSAIRHRWKNYLSPDIVRVNFSPEEKELIIRLHNEGKSWSKIAKRLPGRTQNDIKNLWNCHLKKQHSNQKTEGMMAGGIEEIEEMMKELAYDIQEGIFITQDTEKMRAVGRKGWEFDVQEPEGFSSIEEVLTAFG